MDRELKDYKILCFDSGKPIIKEFNKVSDSEINCEFYNLSKVSNIFPISVLDENNEIVIWNNYFELEEIINLIHSTFKELI